MPVMFASSGRRGVIDTEGQFHPAPDPEPTPETPPVVTPPTTPAEPSSAPSTETPPVAAGQSAPLPSEPPADTEETAVSQEQPRGNRPFVARLIRENERLKRENADKEALLAHFSHQASTPTPPPTAPTPTPTPVVLPRPQPQAYASHEEWVEALSNWTYEQRRGQERAAEQQAAETAAYQQRQSKWDTQMEAGRQKYDDFDEALSQIRVVEHLAPVVGDAVRESDLGPDLFYHLATHPQDMQHLNSLSPLAAARWLGQLEVRLTPAPGGPRAQTATPPAPAPPAAPAPTPTPLPPPMQPVGGGGSPAPPGFRQGMSLTDYERMRRLEREGRRV